MRKKGELVKKKTEVWLIWSYSRGQKTLIGRLLSSKAAEIRCLTPGWKRIISRGANLDCPYMRICRDAMARVNWNSYLCGLCPYRDNHYCFNEKIEFGRNQLVADYIEKTNRFFWDKKPGPGLLSPNKKKAMDAAYDPDAVNVYYCEKRTVTILTRVRGKKPSKKVGRPQGSVRAKNIADYGLDAGEGTISLQTANEAEAIQTAGRLLLEKEREVSLFVVFDDGSSREVYYKYRFYKNHFLSVLGWKSIPPNIQLYELKVGYRLIPLGFCNRGGLISIVRSILAELDAEISHPLVYRVGPRISKEEKHDWSQVCKKTA